MTSETTGVEPVEGVSAQAIAARPSPGAPVADTEVGVPPEIVEELGLRDGDVLRLTSYLERRSYARFREVLTTPGEGAALLRMGRLLWSQLLVKPGEAVTVTLLRDVPPASELRLVPPFHLSHNLGHRLAEAMQAAGSVVWPGARVFHPVFPGGGGVVVEAVAETPEPSVVTEDTKIVYEEPDPDIARRRITFAEIGGLDEAIRRIRDLVELPLLRPRLYRSLGVRAPKGVLLYGPPGTGKTLLSRAVAEELGANVMKLPATELIGTYSGETEANLRSLFNEAAHHAPSLIIIDEIDVLATSRERLASQGDIRAATQLLSLMDGLEEVDGVVVMATTNRVEAIDEAFRRPGRFDEEIYVGPPGPVERREILAIHTREMPLTIEAEEALSSIAAEATAGFTGADLMHLVREAGLAAARRLTSGGRGFEVADRLQTAMLAIEPVDVREGLSRVKPSAMRGLPQVQPRLAWEDIAGLDEVKTELLEAAAAAFAAAGPGARERAEGVLLEGPSGNGKSVLVEALAGHVGANIVMVDGSTVFTQWLGESEAALRALFAKARDVAPSIIALENLDAVAPRRRHEHVESVSSRVLSALLSAVDVALLRGGVLVVGVTDRPEMIDPALLRAGRLGHRLEVPNPSSERRRAIVASVLGSGRDEVVEALVEDTAGLSAAEVERRARRTDM